jgi:sugar lactone lactonase YvrE
MRDGGAVQSGRLHHVAADGRSRALMDGIFCPNSLAFSPDGRTLYFTDTRKGDIRQANTNSDRLELRPFAASDIAPGRPDGSTVDAEGCLWNTRTGGGRVIRLDPNGRLVSTLHLPVSQPTACAFGGADLATLYVTTARQRLSAEQLADEPWAGDLFAFDVGVNGLPEHRYAG